jgi:putative transposase
MTYDPNRHHRRSIRLRGYDYSQAGAYFVTIVTQNREPLFGEVINGEMRLNESGACVMRWWEDIPRHFPGVDTDAFVVMPNHVHGIIVITDADNVGAGSPRPDAPIPPQNTPGTDAVAGADAAPRQRPSLGNVVAYFKYQTTKTINAMRQTPSARIWQRNYYEHIIRDEASLNRIREYIANNPLRWAADPENPGR